MTLSFLEPNNDYPHCISKNDFSPFAELVFDHSGLLQQLKPALQVYEQPDSLWPGAFHLYSGLAYCRG